MLTAHDIAHSLSHTWDSVSQGWQHLVNRAAHALTYFRSDGDNNPDVPAASPKWGLLSADVFDDNDKLVVKLEAPGLNTQDIDINVIENMLTISGEKRFQREQTQGHYRVLECAYGRFSRTIPLEHAVDTESAKATYDKGILKIELKKLAAQRRQRITIT